MNLFHVTKFFLYLPLTFLYFYKKLLVSFFFFIHKNCFGLSSSTYYLFWEVVNLNLRFGVCRNRDSKSLYYLHEREGLAICVDMKYPIIFFLKDLPLIGLAVICTGLICKRIKLRCLTLMADGVWLWYLIILPLLVGLHWTQGMGKFCISYVPLHS